MRPQGDQTDQADTPDPSVSPDDGRVVDGPAVGDPPGVEPTAGDPAVGEPIAGDQAVGDPAVGDPAVGGPVAGRRVDRLVVLAVMLAVAPLIVAAVRVIRSNWVVVSDGAFITVRAHDVFSDSPPLVGLWAYTSLYHGFDYNHPGPLLFDLLSVPVLLFGNDHGAIIGTVALNALCLVGIVVVAHRRGGAPVAAVAAATSAALCAAMSMGSLVEPWHASSTVLPFVLLGLLVWSIVRGDVVCLPWAAAVGSLVLQTSLSYGALVPGLGAWAVIGLVVELRRRRRDDPESALALRRRVLRSGTIGVVVLAVCWAQPIWEQLTGVGEGNLTRLVRSIRRPLSELSPASTAPKALRTASAPPRSPDLQVMNAYEDLHLAVRVLVALVVLAVLGALAVWCVRTVRRRRDLESSSLLATAAVTAFLGLLTAARAPAPTIAPYQVRAMWPVGALVVLAVLTTVARRFADRPSGATRVIGAAVTFTGLVAVFNLVPSDQGFMSTPGTYRVASEVVTEMDTSGVQGPVRMECSPPGAPYCQAVMAELDDRGLAFISGESDRERRIMGEDRASGDHRPTAKVVVISGDAAGLPRPGARRVAFHDGLDERERTEHFFLADDVARHLGRPGHHLTDAGRRDLDDGASENALADALVDEGGDGRVSFDFGDGMTGEQQVELARMIDAGLIDVDDAWKGRMDQFAELTRRLDEESVAIFLAPPD